MSDFVRKASSIISGAATYVCISWIPLLGPIFSGVIAGKVRKGGGREGFSAGAFGGLIGFAATSLLLNYWGIWSSVLSGSAAGLLLGWIYLVYNIAGVALAGVGGVLGSMLASFEVAAEPQACAAAAIEPESLKDAVVYRICPECGIGFKESDGECASCGWLATQSK